MATKKKPSDFKALMLRTCDADMSAHGGFAWPTSGYVKAPDWNPKPVCGGGLHGALWGEGDGSLFEWSSDAKWLVCGINKWVDLDGKVKTDRAYVLYCGDRLGATAYIQKHGARGAVIGGTATAGHRGTATAGYCGTATAGDGGTLVIKWWDGIRYRLSVGYVGEGIEPNVKYKLDSNGKFIKA